MSVQTLLFVALLLVASQSAVIYFPGIPVNPILVYQLQVACDRLED